MKKLSLVLFTALLPIGADGAFSQAGRDNARRDVELAEGDPVRMVLLDGDELKPAERVCLHLGLLAGPGPTLLGERAVDVLVRMSNDRYDQAIAEYLRQLDAVRQDLSPPPGKETDAPKTSRDQRGLLLQLINDLPPSIVERYRRVVDAEAQQLLREGETTRSPAPLCRLVREFFPSRPTEQALALLGDWAFEQGQFDEAISWWRLLAPLSDDIKDNATRLVYAHGSLDPERIRAKQILALTFAGRFADAESSLDNFRRRAGPSRGPLAGRDDLYVTTLRHWLERRRAEPLPGDTDWPTFAGAPSRNRIPLEPPSERLWIDGPSWRVPLTPVGNEIPELRLTPTRTLAVPIAAHHPILVDGQVVITDGTTVTSFDQASGGVRFRYRVGDDEAAPEAGNRPETLRFSVSAGRGKVVARLGPSGKKSRRLVALHLDDRKDDRLAWKADAPIDEQPADFECDPLVLEDHVYVVVRQPQKNHADTFLACYDLADGHFLWQTLLAKPDLVRDGSTPRAPLLIAAESNVVALTHAGYIVACDATTGQRQWALRYPSIEGTPSPREFSSGVHADGRLFLAPADGASLLAVDALTGRVVWELPWLRPSNDIMNKAPKISEIVQLYGVVGGRLIFTDRYRLQAVDAGTGTVVWQQPSVGKLPGIGRGLIAGPWVFWPTADPQLSWRAVSHADGDVRRLSATDGPAYYEPTTLRNLPAGNVAFADGCLVVAGPKELVAFVASARSLPHLEREARRSKVEPDTLYRLALAQLDAGRDNAAQATLTDLWSRVPFTERPAWEALLAERRGVSKPFEPIVREARATFGFEADDPSPEGNLSGTLQLAWGPIPGLAPRIHSPVHNWMVIVRDGELALVDASTGETRWRRGDVEPSFQWLCNSYGALIVAGPHAIEIFAAKDGKRLWRQVPADRTGRWHLVDGQPRRDWGTSRFDAFLDIGAGVAFFENGRDLRTAGFASVATEPATRKGIRHLDDTWLQPIARVVPPVLSSAWGPDRVAAATVPEGGETYSPAEVERRVVRLPHGFATAMRNGEIVAGKSWRFIPSEPTTLTGEPPQLMGNKDGLLALVPRNLGTELVRVDDSTGRAMWSVPCHELHDGFDVRAASFDDYGVYYPYRGHVTARSMIDGLTLWKKPLPPIPGPWQVDRYGDTLVVWPRTASGIPILPMPDTALLAPVALAWGRRGIGSAPVMLIDSRDGRIRQQIEVPHDGGPVFVWAKGPLLFATAGGKVWAYRSR
jgi:outer membrane protein assembly factor BamB